MSREPIRMPVLSDTMERGQLVSWLKKPGDPVKKGEVIAEVESDKAVMEVEATADGYLQGPLAEPGSELPVGAVMGWIALRPGEEAPPAAAPEPAKEPAPEETPEESAGSPPERETETAAREPALPPRIHARSTTPRSSPYARALARELGIDLDGVKPGADGTIRSPQVVAAALGAPQPELEAGPPWTLEPLTTMQRAVAEGTAAAARQPLFRVSARLPLEPLRQFCRERGLSFTLGLARLCAQTVEAHPRFNAAFTPDGLALRRRVDVGIAVELPDGLVTPVLRNVARRPVAALAQAWQALREKARRRALSREEYSGATFYLSNLGTHAVVEQFDAILPVGAAAILAVAALRDGKALCTLTCDHRVVYGADAARFLETLSTLLENPEKASNW